MNGIGAGGLVSTLGVVLGAVLSSAVLTALLTVYSRWRGIVDSPGRRRSHRLPTPRGGGLAIAIVVLAWECWRMAMLPRDAAGSRWLVAAIAIVALVGWREDHRETSRRLRLLAHVVAGTCLAAGAGLLTPHPDTIAAALALMVVTGVAWSINLHNFMDGIDGLLSMQALFVFFALIVLMAADMQSAKPAHLIVWAAAIIGFIPFNFPRARVFLGDAGSGVLGLLVAQAILWQWRGSGIASWTGVVLASAFLVDASCTLGGRILTRRHWYSAHREHLYQWLVRRGFSHRRVVAVYMIWNLFAVLPVALWMNRSDAARASPGTVPALLLIALSVVAWLAGKRWCLAEARHSPGKDRAIS